MFYILNSICSDYILAQVLGIIRKIITILGIIVPILLIIGTSITLAKGVMNPEDKKIPKNLLSSIISAVIVFLLPFIINTTMEIISTYSDVGINENGTNVAFNLASCWNYSEKSSSSEITKPSSTNSSSKSIYQETDIIKTYQSKKQEYTSYTTQNVYNNINKIKKSVYNKLVLIGDSRFYGQQNYGLKDSNTIYIAKSGEGISFLKKNINNLKQYNYNTTAYVINLGINDRYNSKQYIQYINNLVDELDGTIYYLSVNPVEESKQKGKYRTSNKEVDDFNKAMKNGLVGVVYLDSNSYLKQNGYKTVDGIHYDKDTSTKIYNFIKSKVKTSK